MLFYMFFRKYNMNASASLEIFQSRASFMELGHIKKHFIKNTMKRVPQFKTTF